MRVLATTISLLLIGIMPASTALGADIDPYYTGPLLAPSPAAPKAGLLAFEPYVRPTIQPGTYDVNGNTRSSANKLTALQTLTLIKYGITDNLSLQVIPTTSNNFDQRGFDSGSQLGDTSTELQYLLTRQDKLTGKPSVTASVGMNFPTGRFQNLYGPSDGFGAGTYSVRLGVLAQSLLFGESDHPVRIRAYASGAIPISSVGVRGFSTFGTDGGFNGRATSGLSGGIGASAEYSISQKLVFAFDILHSYSLTDHVQGAESNGLLVNVQGGGSDTTQIAPALEYSFSDRFGIIAGVALSVAGHNTATIVQPQIAFNFVF